MTITIAELTLMDGRRLYVNPDLVTSIKQRMIGDGTEIVFCVKESLEEIRKKTNTIETKEKFYE